MIHNDLFTDLIDKLVKRGKLTSLDAIKRYLHVYYRISFTDYALNKRLSEFQDFIQPENNQQD